MYEWFLFGHLFGVALLLAGLGAHTVAVEKLRRAQAASDLATLLGIAELGGRLVLIGGPVLIVAGGTLAIRYWSLTDGWIATAIALVVGQGLLGSLVDRRLRRLREALEVRSSETPIAELRALASDPVLHAGSGVSVPVIAEILLLMTFKPAGWEIVWSVGAMAMFAGIGVWRVSRVGADASRVG